MTVLWGSLFCIALFTPLSMIGFGWRFLKKPPKKINSTFGYRTTMSMKNQETWDFAHRYCGKLWTVLGWVTLAVSAAAMLTVFGTDINTISSFSIAVVFLQLIPLVLPFIPTEIALRKTFDQDGKRRS